MTRLLLTAGSTREPIDAVRFIGNRSSGRMGLAIADAARAAGLDVTLILGVAQVNPPTPHAGLRILHVETTDEMKAALDAEWPNHDVLIMAAAVADFRPKTVADHKIRRGKALTLDLEPTADLLASAAAARRPGQRVIGFSLDDDTPEARCRARGKLERKNLDLLIFNPIPTMDAPDISAELFHRDGRHEVLGAMSKQAFAARLIEKVSASCA